MSLVKIEKALLSVTDKTDIMPLAHFLVKQGVEIISSGGTAAHLRQEGIPVTDIEKVSGSPEAFQGRMKTISFNVASGLLFRRDDAADVQQAQDLKIPRIDLVVCNLYQFEQSLSMNLTESELVDKIDIGGPLMIRSAAKNYAACAVLSNPDQYAGFIAHYAEANAVSLPIRKKLAAEAFDLIARYDVAIAEKLGSEFLEESRDAKFLSLRKENTLRYGENPHQSATMYSLGSPSEKTLATAKIHQGKELSYNNILDADGAWRVVSDIQNHVQQQGFTCAIVKHGNPCGLSHSENLLTALTRAWEGDSTSAFGGIIAFSHEVTGPIAEFFNDKFVEIVMAPKFSTEALTSLAKKKNVRVVELPLMKAMVSEKTIRSFWGGALIQMEDEQLSKWENFKSVTASKMKDDQKNLCEFGVIACKHLKSNGIALVQKTKDGLELVGAGMGQPNRIDSFLRLALPRAQAKNIASEEMVLISDAFFPFPDTVEIAAKEGIKSIIQPGGSLKDNEVIAAADKAGIAMMFTGERHFRH